MKLNKDIDIDQDFFKRMPFKKFEVFFKEHLSAIVKEDVDEVYQMIGGELPSKPPKSKKKEGGE